jgi:hypothetical protein
MALPAALLSLLVALARLAAALAKFFSDRRLISAGEAAGRAAAEHEHTRAAQAVEAEMRAVAEQPASRDELLRRLDEGTA